MLRALISMAGFALLLCAGLSLMNAQESAASVQAATKACIKATVARAAETQRLFGTTTLPITYDHCAYNQNWDQNRIAFASISLVGGLGLLVFALVRRPSIA